MFWDIKVTPEEEEEIIHKVAEKIHQQRFNVAAILFLESVKPFAYFWGQTGRFALSPWLPALGNQINITGEKLFQVFEKRGNLEKLVSLLEKMAKEEKTQKEKPEEEKPKKGWRRFLRF